MTPTRYQSADSTLLVGWAPGQWFTPALSAEEPALAELHEHKVSGGKPAFCGTPRSSCCKPDQGGSAMRLADRHDVHEGTVLSRPLILGRQRGVGTTQRFGRWRAGSGSRSCQASSRTWCCRR